MPNGQAKNGGRCWVVALDERLSAVAALVRPNSRVADIGADHGYLIARLLLDQKAVFGYACDIHRGPLDKAKETLKSCGLEDRSQLFLGDGLSGLLPEQVDDIVIAGMGADTILHILDEAGWRDPGQRFLLQPMSKHHLLRAGLYKRGYEILQEKAVIVKGFAYTVMQARWCGRVRAVDNFFARTGLLPLAYSAAAEIYLEKQAQALWNAAKGLEQSNTNGNYKMEYYETAGKIQEILERWKREKG